MRIDNYLKESVQEEFDALLNNPEFKKLSAESRNYLSEIYIGIFEENVDLSVIESSLNELAKLSNKDNTTTLLNNYTDAAWLIVSGKNKIKEKEEEEQKYKKNGFYLTDLI